MTYQTLCNSFNEKIEVLYIIQLPKQSNTCATHYVPSSWTDVSEDTLEQTVKILLC